MTIAIGTNPGSGTLSGTLTVSAVNGVATFSNLSINKAANGYVLSASASGLTSGVSGSFNISAAAASQLAFTVQPANAVAGAAISAVQVTVRGCQRQYGNPRRPIRSHSRSARIPGSGTLGGTVTVSASNGVATFSSLSINNAGTGYTLAATSAGLTAATSSAFNVTAGTASKLVFSVQPSNTAAGASITPAVTVTIQDAGGNTVTTSTAAVTIAIGAESWERRAGWDGHGECREWHRDLLEPECQ